MFRRAETGDLNAIAAIYDEIHSEIEAGRASIGWIRGVYPTRATAEASIRLGDMYVEIENGEIVAAARINQHQGPEYDGASWSFDAPPVGTRRNTSCRWTSPLRLSSARPCGAACPYWTR